MSRHLPVASMDLVPPGMMRWLPIILIIPSYQNNTKSKCARIKDSNISEVAGSTSAQCGDTR